jgi:hypothetical protein
MNDDRDLIRLLDSWFADGPVQVADRVMDDTANRIARQRQTPAWRLRSWRFPAMSTPIKLVAIGAALLAVLVGGAIFVGGGARTAPPTPAPTPTPTPKTLPTGELEPGTYITQPFPDSQFAWTLTVPAQWNGFSRNVVFGPDSPPDKGAIVALVEKATIPADSCAPEGLTPATTGDEFVALLQARQDWHPSQPVDVTIDGYVGSRVDVEAPAEINVCGAGEDYMILVENEAGEGFYAQGPSNRVSLWVMDIGGRPIVILRSSFAETAADQVVNAEHIIESSRLTP